MASPALNDDGLGITLYSLYSSAIWMNEVMIIASTAYGARIY